jgi:hypothetical protein
MSGKEYYFQNIHQQNRVQLKSSQSRAKGKFVALELQSRNFEQRF